MSVQPVAVAARLSGRDWGLLLLLSLLWGGSFLFNGIAVRSVPVLTVVVGRVALAALFLWAVMAALRIAMPRDPAVWRAFLGMGILNNVIPFCLIVWAQGHIPSGLAAILNGTTPLFTVLVAHALTNDEKLTPARLVGVLTGFVGVVVTVGAVSGRFDGGIAPLASLGAALSYGFAGVYGRRFRRLGVAPLATATGQVTLSAALLLPAMLIFDRPWTQPMPGWEPLLALAGLAVLSTGIAYIVFFRLLASAGATNLSLVTLLIPVSALLLGALVLGEPLVPRHLVGMALIALGLAVIDGRLWARVSGGRGA